MPGQPFYPNSLAQLRALQSSVSPARLSTYERLAYGNSRRGVALYLWNARAAGAFYFPLQTNEILLRNAISAVLARVYGANWPFSAGFERSLPRKSRGIFNTALTDLVGRLGPHGVAVGDVIAALTYGFWVALLTARHDTRLWVPYFRTAFPGAPAQVDREFIYNEANLLRDLRNRIAHHEPIAQRDLAVDYKRTLRIIRWICPTTASWVVQHSQLASVINQRP